MLVAGGWLFVVGATGWRREGYKRTWKVLPMFVDVWEGAKGDAVTVAQGLANEKHRVELVSEGGEAGVKAVRVYRPAVK